MFECAYHVCMFQISTNVRPADTTVTVLTDNAPTPTAPSVASARLGLLATASRVEVRRGGSSF